MGKKLTLIQKQEIINKFNKNIVILSEFYRERKIGTECNCMCEKCGFTFTATWRNLNKGSRGEGCPKCARKRITAKERQEILDNAGADITILKIYSKYRGKTVVSKDTYCTCKCNKDGYVWDSLWGNLKRGSKCPKCSNKNLKYNKNEIQLKLNSLNMDIDVLDSYILTVNNHSKTFVKCKCNKDNNIWESSLANLFEGKGCSRCKLSNMENITANILKDLNIDFVTQHRFDDCRNILPLPFDFYLTELKTAIELDGEQHFKPTAFGGIEVKEAEENFKKTIKNDMIKNNYCYEKNIKLIRIPYYHLKNIKDILLKELKYDNTEPS